MPPSLSVLCPTITKKEQLSIAIQKLEQMALEAINIEDTPGIAVGIFDRHDTYYVQGFGVTRKEYPGPVTPSTLFQMASISKPIHATALAVLQQKRLCSLKDHPHRYLPELFNGDAYINLRLENMLNHSSGVTYEGFEELIESYIPRKIILDKLAETLPTSQPGLTFEYNNVVYGLIEDVICAVTNKPLDTVLRESLFDPLGMQHACIGLPALLDASDRFYPYLEGVDGKLAAAPHYSHSYYIFPASAGVNASIMDLIPFIQLYLGRFPEIMPQEALLPLITPSIDATKSLAFLGMPREPIKEAWYGLGWLLLNVGEARVVYHTGYLNGVRNFIAFLPDHGIGITLLANTERMVASKLGLEFIYQYLGM